MLTILSGYAKLSWVSGLEQKLESLQSKLFSAELRYSTLLAIPTAVTGSGNGIGKKILALARLTFASPAFALDAAITAYITINQAPDKTVRYFCLHHCKGKGKGET